jgi:hypothetical protein
MSALRYALGSHTYIVHVVIDEILANWDEIDDWDKDRIVDEIKTSKRYHDGKLPLYNDQWIRIIRRWSGESERCHQCVNLYNCCLGLEDASECKMYLGPPTEE